MRQAQHASTAAGRTLQPVPSNRYSFTMYFAINAFLNGAIATFPFIAIAALFVHHCLRWQAGYYAAPAPPSRPQIGKLPSTLRFTPSRPVQPVKVRFLAVVAAASVLAAVVVPADAQAIALQPLPDLANITAPAKPDFSTMKVRELRDYCKNNGIKGWGKHAESKAALAKFLDNQTRSGEARWHSWQYLHETAY